MGVAIGAMLAGCVAQGVHDEGGAQQADGDGDDGGNGGPGNGGDGQGTGGTGSDENDATGGNGASDGEDGGTSDGGGATDGEDGGDAGSGGEPGPLPDLALELVHSGLDQPVDLQAPPDGTGRLFLVEQPGRIRISSGGTLQSRDGAFLDITDRIETAGTEQGLLGLAFHPDFAANGRFYVNYTTRLGDAGDTVIAEYRVSDDPGRADPDSETVLLRIGQPYENHNGGQLQFGPDGMLYIGMGDGGAGCDPEDRAQNTRSLLGKMLRLDVDRPPSFVPEDNPFAGGDPTDDLIWALGLRNPWRFSFDPETGDLYIADVGQHAREEINAVSVTADAPLNFGWRTFEGTLSPPQDCEVSSVGIPAPVAPVVEYGHDEGCSITGGYVYRGSALPDLDGVYLYSDYCQPFLGTLRMADGAVAAESDITADVEVRGGSLNNPSSFGVDAEGELYVLDHDGDVFRFIGTAGG